MPMVEVAGKTIEVDEEGYLTNLADWNKDVADYLHRARGKLSKLRKVAEFFSANYQRVSMHTNFEMAAVSLKFVVQQIEEVLASVPKSVAASSSPIIDDN